MGQNSKGEFRGYFTFKPDPKAVQKATEALGEEWGDFRPLWARVWPVMQAAVLSNIASRGAAIGSTWLPYTPAYEKRKRRGTERRGGVSSQGRRLEMHLTGALLQQLRSKSGLLKMTKRLVSFGSTLAYAPRLNFRIRRFMGWTKQALDQVQGEFNSYGAEILNRWDKKVRSAAGTNGNG